MIFWQDYANDLGSIDEDASGCFGRETMTKLKIGRAATLFYVMPTAMFLVTFSLENVDDFRPHGTTAFTLFCYGVVTPSILVILNKKLFNFAKEQLLSLICFRMLQRRPRIYPLIEWLKFMHELLKLCKNAVELFLEAKMVSLTIGLIMLKISSKRAPNVEFFTNSFCGNEIKYRYCFPWHNFSTQSCELYVGPN